MNLLFHRPLVALMICLLLSGCLRQAPTQPQSEAEVSATPPASPRPSTVSWLLHYGKYTRDLQELVDSASDSGLELLFPVIPGAFFGTASNQLMAQVEANNGQFELALPAQADSLALPWLQSGVTVLPADTQLLRLGSFYRYRFHPSQISDGGFIDKRTHLPLLLMYFDRPATISGQTAINQQMFEFDISVPNSGWHWLQLSPNSSGGTLLQRYSGGVERIEFTVLSANSISM